MKTISPTWSELYTDAKNLAQKLKAEGSWDQIIAITRGGLVPAAVIAKELDIRFIDTVCVKSYNDTEKENIQIIKRVDNTANSILVIDDLVDTGETARAVRDMFPHAWYAVIYAKPAGLPLVNSYVKKVSQDTWILFPWERDA